jgi:hypothetical protein
MALVAAALSFAGPLQAAVEFSGYMITAKETRFSLKDTEKKDSSQWLAVGQSFQGYTITGFDAEQELLSLQGPEGAVQLKVRGAMIKDARMTIAGTIQLGAEGKIEVAKATLVLGEETAFPLPSGVTLHLKPTRLPDGTMRYDSRFAKRGADGKQQVLSAPSVVTLPGSEFSVRTGEYSYTFKP